MAVTATSVPLRALERAVSDPFVKISSRRHTTFQAGRALEILGHAIEYLTDEYLQKAEQILAHDPYVQAVQILMALNRQIYYACPLQPTFTERLRAVFHSASH